MLLVSGSASLFMLLRIIRDRGLRQSHIFLIMSAASKVDAVYLIAHSTFESKKIERLLVHLAKYFPSLPQSKIIMSAPSWGTQLSATDCFNIYDPWMTRPGWPSFTWKNRCLLKGEISLVVNFYNVMKHSLDNGHKTILVFESDIFLRDDFEARFVKLFETLEGKEWDYVSLSDGIGSHANGYTNVYMPQTASAPPHQWVFRCTDSMIFQTEIFKKIIHTILPFRDCLDWEMNFQFLLHGGKSLWAEPHLVEQGTNKYREITSLPA